MTNRRGLGMLVGLLFLAGSMAEAATATWKEGMLTLGDPAPDFRLRDVVTGKTVARDDFADKQTLLVIFICRHCPYVVHIQEGLAQLARDYQGKSVGIVGVSSNDPADFPEDAPESLKEMAQGEGFIFPFLFDETQQVALAYTAVCTPEPFLFDGERRLVYRGQFDDSRPGSSRPVTGKDLRQAMDAVLEGRAVPANQVPATGCSIKWKRGNRPRHME